MPDRAFATRSQRNLYRTVTRKSGGIYLDTHRGAGVNVAGCGMRDAGLAGSREFGWKALGRTTCCLKVWMLKGRRCLVCGLGMGQSGTLMRPCRTAEARKIGRVLL
jgi:hypothetical protein